MMTSQSAATAAAFAIDGGMIEGNESVVVSVAPGAGYRPGTYAAAEITIHDAPPNPEIAALPFREPFEDLSLGALDGQNGWQAVNAVVQDTDAHGGAQACSLTSRTARISHKFVGGETNVWTELWIKPVFATNHTVMADPPAGSSFAFYVYTNGLVTAFDGTNRTQLVHDALTEGEWERFAVHGDYVAKQWDLHLNGERIAADLGFYDTNAVFCTEFGIRGAADDTAAVVDDIRIWTPLPAIGTVFCGR